MTRILVEDVTYAWVTGEPVFQGLNVSLEPAWTGVVGANGSGKSTLLQLLTGELLPDEGRIVRSPAGLGITRCAQVPAPPDAPMRAFASASTDEAGRIRSLLRLADEALDRWETLSPGERKRWQIGVALHDNPPVLLLDEPTNHLDADSKTWLLEALWTYTGIGVLVSHDGALLDALTTQTLWHDIDGEWLVFGDSYHAACASYEAICAKRQERIEALDRQLKHERTQLIDRTRRAQKAETQRSVASRRKNLGDNEAGSMMAGIRVDRSIASSGRKVGVQGRRVERLEEARQSIHVHLNYRDTLSFEWEAPSMRTLMAFHSSELVAGTTLLAHDVNLRIDRDTRARIQGPNGAGKTTLLESIVQRWRHGDGHLTWIPQELNGDALDAVRARLRAGTSKTMGRFLAIYARLGADPTRWLRNDVLSPGEARKMLLAEGLVRQSWLLVLDEPTNHLDPQSVSALREALIAWPGALLVGSHDDAFAQALVNQQFTLADGQWRQEFRDGSSGEGTKGGK